MNDQYKDFSTLDLSTVDFNLPQWSWYHHPDDAKSAIVHTIAHDNGEITSTHYPVPDCMVQIIAQVRNTALAGLKRELRQLDAQRDTLLSAQ